MSAKNDLKPTLSPPTESGIVELSLMLSRNQFDALEERARIEGMSVAQFLRRLVREATSEDLVVS